MRFSSFSFLCDENIDDAVVVFLKESGFQATSIKELHLKKLSDIEILKYAFKNNLVVLTHDSDFGKIIYSQQIDFLGVVYLRPGHFQAVFTINSLKTLIGHNLEFNPPFIAVAEQKENIIKVRLRNNL